MLHLQGGFECLSLKSEADLTSSRCIISHISTYLFLSILCRLVYWVSLNVCSSWRGFGSGLTVFPLLAMVALNLFLMYDMNLKEPLFGSQDVLYNQVTPSSWPGETSQSPSGKPDVLPTDILDAQWGGELLFLLSEEEIFPNIGHSCGLQFSTATRCNYNLRVCDSLTCIFAPPIQNFLCGFMLIIWNARAFSLLVAAEAFEQCCSLKNTRPFKLFQCLYLMFWT